MNETAQHKIASPFMWPRKAWQGHARCSSWAAYHRCFALLNNRKRVEEEESAQLLGRTGADQSAAWQSGLDDEAQAMSHVRRSKQVLEETFQTGAAILTSMAGQRERLKVRWKTPSSRSISFADALLSVSSLAFEEQQDGDSHPSHKSCMTRTDELSVVQQWKGDRTYSGADDVIWQISRV